MPDRSRPRPAAQPRPARRSRPAAAPRSDSDLLATGEPRGDGFSLVDREMRRADAERRRALMIAGVVALGALGAVAIVVALVFGRMSAAADAADAATPARGAVSVAAGAAGVVGAAPTQAQEATAAQLAQLEAAGDVAAGSVTKKAPTTSARQTAPRPVTPTPEAATPATQRISIAIGDAGYEPTIAEAKAGVPIELTVGQGEGCAAGFIIPELGVELDNSAGPATAKLGALEAGEYRFFCAMEMVEGRLIVR